MDEVTRLALEVWSRAFRDNELIDFDELRARTYKLKRTRSKRRDSKRSKVRGQRATIVIIDDPYN